MNGGRLRDQEHTLVEFNVDEKLHFGNRCHWKIASSPEVFSFDLLFTCCLTCVAFSFLDYNRLASRIEFRLQIFL